MHNPPRFPCDLRSCLIRSPAFTRLRDESDSKGSTRLCGYWKGELTSAFRFLMALAFFLLWASSSTCAASPQPVPRTIYTFYDAGQEELPRLTLVHRVLEMPLNWLGFDVEYLKHTDPLPAWRKDVAGVVLWLPPGTVMPHQSAYTDWLQKGLNADKKLVIMGNPGFDSAWRDTNDGKARIAAVLKRIGLRDTGRWVELTYTSEISRKDYGMVEFERAYSGILPSYYSLRAIKEDGATVHLEATDKDDEGAPVTSDLVVTHRNGGYIAEGYGFYYELDAKGEDILAQRWMVNPFKFLSAILKADDLPKPDVTTLDGRRIFYSHMDGDGWNNVSEVTDYAHERTITAEVLLKEIYRPYAQLPFTVAPIVAELDTGCYGLKQSVDVTKAIFALPNVEPSSHTWSHPLMWRYFDDGDAGKEEPYLKKYPPRPNTHNSVYEALGNAVGGPGGPDGGWRVIMDEYHQRKKNAIEDGEQEKQQAHLDKVVQDNFTTPRSYACQPYDLKKEIQGSVDYLQKLAPANKKIRLIQWSGDTTPTEKALREVRDHHLLNINGGDSRFDPEYPSYSYVAPIGLKVGAERQIYSSNSNENTYTNLWSDRFFGFRHLVTTVKNTETPHRVSPFNIYYHAYSGEKQPSLEALKQNIGYALSQEIIPMFASDYARIAEGYFSAKLIPLGRGRWKITDRGALQTVRFDLATLKTIDWEHSSGVIGMRHYQGSLYVALDPNDTAPVVALKAKRDLVYPPPAKRPYLIQSHWAIRSLHYHQGEIRLEAQGFGRGLTQLYWPYGQKARLKVEQDGKLLLNQLVNAKDDGSLTLAIHADAERPLVMEVVAEPDV